MRPTMNSASAKQPHTITNARYALPQSHSSFAPFAAINPREPPNSEDRVTQHENGFPTHGADSFGVEDVAQNRTDGEQQKRARRCER